MTNVFRYVFHKQAKEMNITSIGFISAKKMP